MKNEWENPKHFAYWSQEVTCIICYKKIIYGDAHFRSRLPHVCCISCGEKIKAASMRQGKEWIKDLESKNFRKSYHLSLNSINAKEDGIVKKSFKKQPGNLLRDEIFKQIFG